ncbi:DUF4350 domain-containing protein [Haloflavibacter putidus]|uniref:DUF4350 domain-containing protein n=1 Tax=Haloflavibacter putidus TaxID=2576776 RepID=A0A507ZXD3_9FLAO|nr:DUF4350 domain-containing protein [Haloflavibacter putidus]TQD39435.1 DUF4350 domain-containing protein [Haloflavibacter putidus]
MGKTYKLLLVGFLLVLGFIFYLEASKPTPINWYPSYAKTDKIPLGSLVLYESLKESNFTLEEVNNPPYQFLQKHESLAGNYFFLNNNLFLDKAELSKMLNWVENGNTLFLAANNFSTTLLDTLQLEVKTKRSLNKVKTLPYFNFSNPELKAEKAFAFKKEKELVYFSKIDTSKHKILGLASLRLENKNLKDSLVNFLEAPFGEGKILMHSNPELFSNYFMLAEDNYRYAKNALAYLSPQQSLFWDNYYKSGKTIQTSPLYILLNNRYLKWAYYTVLLGALLFIYFEGKRKQKSIPVVKALQNRSYEYTRTIAGMYLEQKKHKEIAEKQINQFYAYLREEFRLEINKDSKIDSTKIASQTGVDSELTNKLFGLIEKIKTAQSINQDQLQLLTQQIIKFKKQI